MKDCFILFRSTIVDEAQWNDRGDVVVPGGRKIAQWLIDALRARSLAASDANLRDYYGWEFDVRTRELAANAVLQQSGDDEWLLVLWPRRSLTGWFTASRVSERLTALGHSVAEILRGHGALFTEVMIKTEME